MPKSPSRRPPRRPPMPAAQPVPPAGLREPCPCGSGKRYKLCHGRRTVGAGRARVARPFEGLAGETEWIALREIVPAATARLTVRAEHAGPRDREVYVATLLPRLAPALVGADGRVWLGVQVLHPSADPSTELAHALLAALAAEPGAVLDPGPPVPGGPRLQDVLDPEVPLQVTLHEGFDFWLDAVSDPDPAAMAALEQANTSVLPAARVAGVQSAYWCDLGDREQVRWVQPHEEERLLDALARLHAAGADLLGPGTRLLGTFRAHGRLVPVWDLVRGTAVADLERPARDFAERLGEALADDSPLTPRERGARAGLANRQVTLR